MGYAYSTHPLPSQGVYLKYFHDANMVSPHLLDVVQDFEPIGGGWYTYSVECFRP